MTQSLLTQEPIRKHLIKQALFRCRYRPPDAITALCDVLKRGKTEERKINRETGSVSRVHYFASAGSTTGKLIVNVVPWSGADWTSIYPW